jgi:glutamate racemase
MPILERKFKVPIFGVIVPGVMSALEKTRSGRIGLIGTSATVRSKAYSNGLVARSESAEVFSQACPLLVPLVEEGWINHPVTQKILTEYLAPLLRRRIDTLILGCTHYPLLKRAIRKVVGSKVVLVDSAEACARYVRDSLGKKDLLARRDRAGTVQPFVTDETDHFGALAKRFFGLPTEAAWKVEL